MKVNGFLIRLLEEIEAPVGFLEHKTPIEALLLGKSYVETTGFQAGVLKIRAFHLVYLISQILNSTFIIDLNKCLSGLKAPDMNLTQP